jgi:hypothetical protein
MTFNVSTITRFSFPAISELHRAMEVDRVVVFAGSIRNH